uniref:Secreted salivary phosphatase n=1 Tax=Xenopsylla cheopis TaxID=163159 RepID=A2IA91_XENCH|nr:secreted salivary phosphatase [Xenopsylla cheopis]
MKSIILLFLVFAVIELSKAEEKLKFVFVTVRGADYEACDYKGGPKITNKDEKESKLTENGKKDAFELGQKIGETYKTKLGVSKWDPKTNFWPIAAPSKRSQTSTLVAAAGMEGDQSKRDKSWTDEELKKTTFPAVLAFSNYMNERECPKFYQQLRARENKIKTILQKCGNSMKEVKKHYESVNPNKPEHIWVTYETLKKLKTQHPSGLDWVTDDIMKNLKECSARYTWMATTSSRALRKLTGGLILYDIFNDMNEIMQGKAQPPATGGKESKLSLFTVPLEILIPKLAVFTPKGTLLDDKPVTPMNIYPEAGAYLDTEMYEENGKWKIKLIYYNGKNQPGKTIRLPDCEEKCPFNKFQKILEKFMINEKDHETLCKG